MAAAAIGLLGITLLIGHSKYGAVNWLSIGPLSFHYYGIIIAAGLLLAVLYAWKRCREFGIRQDDITDGVLWIVPLAIVCARLYYCIFKW